MKGSGQNRASTTARSHSRTHENYFQFAAILFFSQWLGGDINSIPSLLAEIFLCRGQPTQQHKGTCNLSYQLSNPTKPKRITIFLLILTSHSLSYIPINRADRGPSLRRCPTAFAQAGFFEIRKILEADSPVPLAVEGRFRHPLQSRKLPSNII